MESRAERMIEVSQAALEELISGVWEGLEEEAQMNLYENLSMEARTLLRDVLPYEQNAVLERINRRQRNEHLGPLYSQP